MEHTGFVSQPIVTEFKNNIVSGISDQNIGASISPYWGRSRGSSGNNSPNYSPTSAARRRLKLESLNVPSSIIPQPKRLSTIISSDDPHSLNNIVSLLSKIENKNNSQKGAT